MEQILIFPFTLGLGIGLSCLVTFAVISFLPLPDEQALILFVILLVVFGLNGLVSLAEAGELYRDHKKMRHTCLRIYSPYGVNVGGCWLGDLMCSSLWSFFSYLIKTPIYVIGIVIILAVGFALAPATYGISIFVAILIGNQVIQGLYYLADIFIEGFFAQNYLRLYRNLEDAPFNIEILRRMLHSQLGQNLIDGDSDEYNDYPPDDYTPQKRYRSGRRRRGKYRNREYEDEKAFSLLSLLNPFFYLGSLLRLLGNILKTLFSGF